MASSLGTGSMDFVILFLAQVGVYFSIFLAGMLHWTISVFFTNFESRQRPRT